MTVPISVTFSLFPGLYSVRYKVQGFILPRVNQPERRTKDGEVKGPAS